MEKTDLEFWKYAPGAALSADGRYEVSSVDRNTFLLRDGGKIIFLSCEQFEREGTPTIAFQLPAIIEYRDISGTGSVALDSLGDVRTILTMGARTIGREAIFE